MNKTKSIVVTIVLILAVVSFRFYRKYDRQQTRDEQKRKQLEFYLKGEKIRDSIKKVEKDSIERNKTTHLDSMMELNKKKAAEIKELLNKLEKEK